MTQSMLVCASGNMPGSASFLAGRSRPASVMAQRGAFRQHAVEGIVVTGPDDPRAELGRFLRARREQLSPRDLGFPNAGRRRTPGLRREEVAVAAGLSATWYTYLEQGRDRDVSPAVLDSLARTLLMTEDERRYMHLLMYGHVPHVQKLAAEVPISELVRNVVAAADLHPYPVYAADRACNVLAWNRAFVEWYDDFGRLQVVDRNLMRWLFLSEHARERFADWESVGRDLVARWRLESASGAMEAAANRVTDDLKEESALFRRWWGERIVLEHRIAIRRFRRPGGRDCDLRVVPMRTIYDSAPGIFFHFPEPGPTSGVVS